MDVPTWLVWLSIAVLALASAASSVDDLWTARRQMMTVMKVVWPVTALYLGPVAVWAYRSLGVSGMDEGGGHAHAQGSQRNGGRGATHAGQDTTSGAPPDGRSVVKAGRHCGAGCTLGDIVAEWTVFLTGITLAGLALWPEYVADFLLAYLLGIVCLDFSLAPMRGLGLKEGLIAAVKADTLSLTAFAVGLFGWMVLTSFVFFQHQLHPDSPVSWFMMQVGLVIGCATAYPMTWWLLKMGSKETM